MAYEVKCGQTIRIMCDVCNFEFDITYEPKAKGAAEEGTGEGIEIEFCPSCGSTAIGEY